MLISGSLIRPLGNLSVDNQTGRTNSVTQLTPSEPVQTNQTLRAVVEAKQAESMLLRTRQRQSAYLNPNALDPRSQRALSAYQALQQSSERDYVSAVLGVDEYV